MNEQDYIASGILEAYVLGALSAEEQKQVYMHIIRFPEVAAEVREIELAMFRYAELFAIAPPDSMKQRLEKALPGFSNSNSGAPSTPKISRTIPLNPEYRKPTIVWRNAAAVAILICSMAINFYFWNQSNHERQEKLAMKEQINQLHTDQKQLADLVADYRSGKEMMADTGIQTIVMHTMLPGHPMAATVYWSKSNGEAYVAMDALPMPPKGKQYQLWVIQNGKPVSMGTLADNMVNKPIMQKISMNIKSGEAFAISLEKSGGNPSPTTVYVLGKA